MSLSPDIHDRAYQFFIEEVPELLQAIETGILELRRDRSANTVHSVMRAAHSIKGGSASVELDAIKTISHRLETAFRALYNETVEIDGELENLLLQGYDCLQQPLMEQIETGQHNPEAALMAAMPILEALEAKIGADALHQADSFIPSSSDLGVDMVSSIFEIDVAQGLERLQEVAAQPDVHLVREELQTQAEVFSGFGELLELPGFAAIAQVVLEAIAHSPQQMMRILELAIADFSAGRDAVLGGDRNEGGQASAELLALATGESGVNSGLNVAGDFDLSYGGSDYGMALSGDDSFDLADLGLGSLDLSGLDLTGLDLDALESAAAQLGSPQESQDESGLVDFEAYDFDSQAFDSQAFDSQVLEPQAFDSQAFDSQALEPKSSESQTFDLQILESQAFDSQAFDSQAFDSQAFDSQILESQAFDSQAFDSQILESQALDSQAFDSQVLEPQAFDSQAFDSQAFDSQILESQAFDSQAFDSQQLDLHAPVESNEGLVDAALSTLIANDSGFGDPDESGLDDVTNDSLALVESEFGLAIAESSESGLGESGFGESGLVESGFSESGLGEFGLVESGLIESGLIESGLVESSFNESGLVESSLVESGFSESGFSESGLIESSLVESSFSESGLVESGLVEPSFSESSFGESGLVESGLIESGLVESGFSESGLVESGFSESGLVESGLVESGLIESGSVESSFGESGLVESSFGESGLVESGLVESGFSESGLVESGFSESGLVESGFSEFGLVESGLVESGLIESGSVESSFGETSLIESSFSETGLVETGLIESGLVESSFSDSGLIESGLLESGLIESSFDESSFGETGLVESSFGETGLVETGFSESDFSESGLIEASFDESSFGESGLVESGLVESSFGESGLVESGLVESSFGESGLVESGLVESSFGESDLIESGLIESSFGESGLVESSFSESGLIESGLIESGLAGSGLVESSFSESGLVESGLIESGLLESGLVGSGSLESGLVESGLVESSLVESSFSESGLVESGLIESGLLESGLVESGLIESGLPGSGLVESSFSESGLVESSFSESGLVESSFSESGLVESSLIESDLIESNLIESDLADLTVNPAHFSESGLDQADFSSSNLDGDALDDWALSESGFRDVELEDEELEGVERVADLDDSGPATVVQAGVIPNDCVDRQLQGDWAQEDWLQENWTQEDLLHGLGGDEMGEPTFIQNSAPGSAVSEAEAMDALFGPLDEAESLDQLFEEPPVDPDLMGDGEIQDASVEPVPSCLDTGSFLRDLSEAGSDLGQDSDISKLFGLEDEALGDSSLDLFAPVNENLQDAGVSEAEPMVVPLPVPLESGVGVSEAAIAALIGAFEPDLGGDERVESGMTEPEGVELGMVEPDRAESESVELERIESELAEPGMVESGMAKPEPVDLERLDPEPAKPQQLESELAGFELAESGMAEVDLAESGMAEFDRAEPGMAEFDLAESGMAEFDRAESGMAESGMAESGMAEFDRAEPGMAESGMAELEGIALGGTETWPREIEPDSREIFTAPAPHAPELATSLAPEGMGSQGPQVSETLATHQAAPPSTQSAPDPVESFSTEAIPSPDTDLITLLPLHELAQIQGEPTQPDPAPVAAIAPNVDQAVQSLEQLFSQLPQIKDTQTLGLTSSNLEPTPPEASADPQPAKRSGSPTRLNANKRGGASGGLSVKVDMLVLERMNNLVGELVLNRNSLALQQDQLQLVIRKMLKQFGQFQGLLNQLQTVSDQMLVEKGQKAVSNPHSLPPLLEAARLTPSTPSGSKSDIGEATSAEETNFLASFDALEMDRYSDLHTQVQDIFEELMQLEESVGDIGYLTEESTQTLTQQRQQLNRLQNELMWARMLPLDDILGRFPRTLREMCNKYGKSVELKLTGTNVLIDKGILEKLYDPLLHLLRNAFDHGIESPEQRRQYGKLEQGTIEIRAYYQGNQTVIEMRDDGQGVNSEKIAQRLVDLGWFSREELSAIPSTQLYEFIFEAGFSTASQVSELSGRGVGLDVVRAQLKELKGNVTLLSEPGKGSTFMLRLPLTLTVSKLLICQIGSQVMALPSDGIEDLLVPQTHQQKQMQQQRCLLWRDSLIPIYNVNQLLDYNCPVADTTAWKTLITSAIPAPADWSLPLLILSQGSQFFALEVSRILMEQELVIKPFGKAIAAPDYTYGCTILGDGRMIPVLDGVSLVGRTVGTMSTAPLNLPLNSSLHSPLPSTRSSDSLVGGSPESQADALVEDSLPSVPSPFHPPTKAASSHTLQVKTVLVVDDSTAMRRTLALSLEKAGYRVLQAGDGQEALEQLRQSQSIQLVVCDVEMPNMNGFEFLSQRRRQPDMLKVPVVMLTSRSSDKHRRLATQLNANGYFSKPYVEQEFLKSLEDTMRQFAAQPV